MKNIVLSFNQFLAVAACALALGSCNRAEYAMLPKGSSYHGVTRVASPVPTKTQVTAPRVHSVVADEAAPVTIAAAPAAEAGEKALVVPVAAPAVASGSTSSTSPATTTPVAKTEVAKSASVSAALAATAASPVQKLNPLQRLALNKVTKKVNKLMQKATVRQHENTASVTRGGGISGNLRIGIILLLVGLLLGIINYYVGTIVAVIGLVFIVLWLLDQA